MTEIPDDLMKAAVVSFNTAIDMDGYDGSYEVIARAILAERERCAKLAEKRAQEYDEAYEETEFKAHSMGGSAALIAIASRIRSGS